MHWCEIAQRVRVESRPLQALRSCLEESGCGLEHQVFAQPARDDLQPDRQPGLRESAGQGNRRQPGDAEGVGEQKLVVEALGQWAIEAKGRRPRSWAEDVVVVL